VRIVLVSEGIGRKLLQEHKDREGLENLVLLNFQPYSELPDVLASANVLLANVEPESSLFCVPSKILSYLCAGRPVLLSSPPQNLGARVIMRAEAGYVCEPGQPQRFLDYAERLWSDQALCREKGANARRYAEATFDISNISAQFEAVLRGGVVSEETLATRSLDLAHLAAAIPPDEH
jgi:glycosyltransferase involved in cell wall biosynthesis